MVVDGVREEGTRRAKGGEPSGAKMAALYRQGKLSLTPYVASLTYLLMAMTGLGYLALTWSTVVLLGGFVTSLQRKDFWCITAISMIQAARIFNDLGDQLVPRFFKILIGINQRTVALAREWLAFQTVHRNPIPPRKISTWLRILMIVYAVVVYVPVLLLLAVCYIVVFLYGYGGPITCIGLALWRIVQRDYGSNNGDVTKANLAPALDMFYSLILCQGVLYLIWLFFHLGGAFLIVTFRQNCNMPRKWGYIWLVDYLFDTGVKCWRDPASIEGRTISRYAIDLMDSESLDENLSGTRMLAMFIRQGADVRSLLLPSRPRIQKLIDTLGWRATSRQMRKAAACIVIHLAGDIHLAQFPGAIQCISTLLQDEEATLTYWSNHDQQQGRPRLHTRSRSTMHALIHVFEKFMPKTHVQEVHQQGDDGHDAQYKKLVDDEADGGCNEMILEGLTILERLSSNHHNCMEICSTPGLLPKIMAPLFSDTLIQGIKNRAWADIVNGTFKVLYSLIRCPGWTGTNLRHEISTSKQAISNLERLLDQSTEAGQELQMRAMEILTELVLDLSINLDIETKENLIKKQLKVFLNKDSAALSKQLRAAAGRTLLATLSTNNEVNSAIVNENLVCLTEILDAKNDITYRIIAAQILESMCAHSNLVKECVKDTLLLQVLTGLLSHKTELPQSGEYQKSSEPVEDEENQNKFAPGNEEENHKICAHRYNIEIQKTLSITDKKNLSDKGNDELTATKELQEAFLSLTLATYDKLIGADDFNNAILKKGLGNGEFVVMLNTMIQENCKETAISLRIVKLCSQIAVSMMRCGQYIYHFKNQGFVESLSEAKKIMSNLESCLLFAGTDLGRKKVAWPLLSELEKEVLQFIR